MNKHERTRTQLFDKLLAISPELGDVREKLHEVHRDQFDDGFVKARHVAGELGIIDPDAEAPAVYRAIVRHLTAEHGYDQAQVEAMTGEQLAELLQASHPSDTNERKPTPTRPLTDSQRAVFDLLWELEPGKGLSGDEIVRELNSRRVWISSTSTLTTHIIPALRKAGIPVENVRTVGYFIVRT